MNIKERQTQLRTKIKDEDGNTITLLIQINFEGEVIIESVDTHYATLVLGYINDEGKLMADRSMRKDGECDFVDDELLSSEDDEFTPLGRRVFTLAERLAALRSV